MGQSPPLPSLTLPPDPFPPPLPMEKLPLMKPVPSAKMAGDHGVRGPVEGWRGQGQLGEIRDSLYLNLGFHISSEYSFLAQM